MSIQSGAGYTLVFPRPVKDIRVYYELTAWCVGKKNDTQGIGHKPYENRRPIALSGTLRASSIAGKVSSFTVPSGNELRAFRRVRDQGKSSVARYGQEIGVLARQLLVPTGEDLMC